jgi:hypothetical protein
LNIYEPKSKQLEMEEKQFEIYSRQRATRTARVEAILGEICGVIEADGFKTFLPLHKAASNHMEGVSVKFHHKCEMPGGGNWRWRCRCSSRGVMLVMKSMRGKAALRKFPAF